MRHNRVLRAIVLTLSALALTVGSAVSTAGAAQAAVRPASCSTINIGSPGNFKLYGMYAGQVEQQYNSCNGNAQAHWQWSTAFRNTYPTAQVTVSLESSNGLVDKPLTWSTAGPDAYSLASDIHAASPDTWFVWASVSVNGYSCGLVALGDQHIYATGGTTGSTRYGGC
ncbi:hypothetical protein [Streptacidiphilus sp. PAMC 29251]